MHFTSEEWVAQKYQTRTAPSVRCWRFLWLLAWTLLCRWNPYFLLRGWRVFWLRAFGMKTKGPVAVYPSVRVWNPRNRRGVRRGHGGRAAVHDRRRQSGAGRQGAEDRRVAAEGYGWGMLLSPRILRINTDGKD